MIRVLRVGSEGISPELRALVFEHCQDVERHLQDNLLSKHYDWFRLAFYLSTSAHTNFMYILYEDDTPLGVMCYSEAHPAHFNCRCVVEDLLYLAPPHRSLRNIAALVKKSLQLLREDFSGEFLVFAGSTIGPAGLEALYKRLGFTAVGTHLVLELEGLSQKKD